MITLEFKRPDGSTISGSVEISDKGKITGATGAFVSFIGKTHSAMLRFLATWTNGIKCREKVDRQLIRHAVLGSDAKSLWSERWATTISVPSWHRVPDSWEIRSDHHLTSNPYSYAPPFAFSAAKVPDEIQVTGVNVRTGTIRNVTCSPMELMDSVQRCTGPCECHIEPDAICPHGWPALELALIRTQA